MQKLFIKIGLIIVLSFGLTSKLLAEDLDSRFIVNTGSDSNLQVKSNYLTYYLLRLKDAQGNLSTDYKLVEPTGKAIDFNFIDFSGSWTGIFPDDIDFSFPTKNFQETNIKLNTLDTNNWDNSNVIIRSASLSALGKRYKESGLSKDDIILVLYNFLQLTDTSLTALGNISGIGDQSKLKDSVSTFAEKALKYQDELENIALYMGILKTTSQQVANLISITGSDDPALIQLKNISQIITDVMDKLVAIQGISIGDTKPYEATSELILKEKYKKLIEKFSDSTIADDSIEALNNRFADLYQAADDKKKEDLLAIYAIEPLNQLLLNYRKKLEYDFKESRVISEREKLQKQINFLKNGRAVLLVASFFIASDDYIKMAKTEPEKLIPFFVKLAKDISASVLTIDNATVVASNFASKYSVSSKKLIGKANAYMKAFTAGAQIGNTFLPMLWDMTLAREEFVFTLKDGQISRYGTTSSKVVLRDATNPSNILATFSNEVNKQNGIVEIENGTSVEVLTGLTQESLFTAERAPWINDSAVVPSTVYDIVVQSPVGYTQDYLCVRKPLVDTDFALHHDEGTGSWSIISGLCGSGTWLGKGWYDNNPPQSIAYDINNIPNVNQLLTLPSETDDVSKYVSENSFVYDGSVATLLVQISGNYINSINHKIILVPNITIPDTIVNTATSNGVSSADVNLSSIVASLNDPIISYSIDWGDGTLDYGITQATNQSHIYATDGIYTVKVTIETENGLIKTTTNEISIANRAPLAQAQNITVSQDSTNNTITLRGSDVDGDTLSYALVTQTTNGTLSGTTQTLTYTPSAGYSGNDSFTFKVNDGTVDSATATVNITVTATSVATSMIIKKTGQTQSYDLSGTTSTDGSIKDDGYYQKGATPRYTRGSDIVIDELTGVIWQDDADTRIVKKPWVTQENFDMGNYNDTSGDTAMTYCSNLTLGGYTDWRMPTSIELESIVNYGQNNPSIDTTYFNNIISSKYWSSTTYVGYRSGGTAWSRDFFYGIEYNNRDKNNTFYIRCVRDGQL